MTTDRSISIWLDAMKVGDDAAVQRLWERYFEKLVSLARGRLTGAARRAEDEEDVALSAFNSFCLAARKGRFPQLNDRHDLWKVLITLTIRKANEKLRHHHRQKRGGGNVRGESVFLQRGHGDADRGLEQVLAQEPAPELAVLVSEEYERLLEQLGDETLRQIALLKMEGYSNAEIAKKLQSVPRTVERKLQRIRSIWEAEADR